ncbi:DUF4352 domain-containing protein [Nocardiopsis nanhaiensis]
MAQTPSASVVVGNLRFTVRSVRSGVPAVEGDRGSVREPEGKFTVVELYVLNTGDQKASFYTGAQRLVDNEGAEHMIDPVATALVETVLDSLKPGEAGDTALVFDLTERVEPLQILLCDTYDRSRRRSVQFVF